MNTKLKRKSPKIQFDKPENLGMEEQIFSPEIHAEIATPPLTRLTWEVAFYGLIFFVAVGLRLWDLNGYLLSNPEATQSLAAWQIYQGNTTTSESYSPLLASIQTFTFFLLGNSETTARLATVLLGSLLVLLPLSLRRQLGAKVCLLSSVMLTLSPTALFLSRTLNGEIGVAVGSLMIVAGFFNWAADRQQHWLYFLASGLAILLTSGPMAYSVIIVFAVLALVGLTLFFKSSPDIALQWAESLTQPMPEESFPFEETMPKDNLVLEKNEVDLETPPLKEKRLASRPTKPVNSGVGYEWQSTALFFVVMLIILATTAMLNFRGFSQLTNFPIDWLNAFRLKQLGEAAFNAVLLLTMLESMIVILGLVGLGYAILQNNLFQLAFGGWFVGLLLLDVIMGGRPLGSVILPLVPLTFLAAFAIAWLWESMEDEGSWHNEGLLLAIGLVLAAFGYIGLTGWLIRTCNADDRLCQYAWIQAAAAALLFVIVAILFKFITDLGVAMRGIALTLVGVGLLITINNASRLNYGAFMNLSYQPMAGLPASTELVALTETLSSQSSQRAGDAHLLDITFVGTPSAALRWQLRNYPNLTQISIAPNQPTTTVLITPVVPKEKSANFGDSYIGQSFGLNAVWSPVGLSPKDLLKWFIYRRLDTVRPQSSDNIVLWLRTEN